MRTMVQASAGDPRELILDGARVEFDSVQEPRSRAC